MSKEYLQYRGRMCYGIRSPVGQQQEGGRPSVRRVVARSHIEFQVVKYSQNCNEAWYSPYREVKVGELGRE